MSKSKYSTVRGGALLAVLQLTVFPVKWICGSPPYPRLSAAQALLIARCGTYEGKAADGRVYHIRELQRKVSPPDPVFWDGRGVLRFRDNDGPNSPPLKIRRQLLSDLWDRILLAPPAYWK